MHHDLNITVFAALDEYPSRINLTRSWDDLTVLGKQVLNVID